MENLTRCFIAIDFNKKVEDDVENIQKILLNKKIFHGKLTEKNNLHLTLKFLGEIDETKLEEVKKRLREIKFNKFKAYLGEIGFFSPSRVKIVWIHILSKQILELQKLIDEKLNNLFKKEERFMSHLTIARVKNIKDKKLFINEIKKIKTSNLEFDVNSFFLVKSELSEKGPIYTDIEKFPLE